MQVRFLPGAPYEKSPLRDSFRLGLCASDRFCESRLLSRRGVLLDHPRLRCLVDCLVCRREGLFGLLGVSRNELADHLGSVRQCTLATHVEYVLLERCAMRLLR